MQLKRLDALNKPYKIYASHLESAAIDQFVKAMELDCVVQGALMPDAHAGYTLPIGAVIATEGTIFPSFVGYDIGCGVCAIPTTFKRHDIEQHAKAIFDQIYRDVPTGFAHHDKPLAFSYDGPVSDFVRRELIHAGAPDRQLGTLGSGNHFIEVGHDASDVVWIVIHSGSRNVGHTIAKHYMKVASGSDKAKEGHYPLDVGSRDGRDYIADLAFGLRFALDNRLAMIRAVERAIRRHAPGESNPLLLINRNHNHAEQRGDRWIHRKGATHAEAGMLGVVPGNMRDGSFIVSGKGNPDSLCSSSHGAGRVLSRKAAKSTLDLDAFAASMKGIQARVDGRTLDESPDAYKSIYEVMAQQSVLVEVLHHIRPLINIKG